MIRVVGLPHFSENIPPAAVKLKVKSRISEQTMRWQICKF